MLHTLLQPVFIVLLFVLASSAELAITNGYAHNTIRAAVFGFIAVLALIVVVLTLL